MAPNHKFLALDVIYANGSWEEDAYGSGKVPGWFTYLQRRRQEGRLNRIAHLDFGGFCGDPPPHAEEAN